MKQKEELKKEKKKPKKPGKLYKIGLIS